jgi:hypothetical protein
MADAVQNEERHPTTVFAPPDTVRGQPQTGTQVLGNRAPDVFFDINNTELLALATHAMDALQSRGIIQPPPIATTPLQGAPLPPPPITGFTQRQPICGKTQK